MLKLKSGGGKKIDKIELYLPVKKKKRKNMRKLTRVVYSDV